MTKGPPPRGGPILIVYEIYQIFLKISTTSSWEGVRGLVAVQPSARAAAAISSRAASYSVSVSLGQASDTLAGMPISAFRKWR